VMRWNCGMGQPATIVPDAAAPLVCSRSTAVATLVPQSR
jgi:hypothetical protein